MPPGPVASAPPHIDAPIRDDESGVAGLQNALWLGKVAAVGTPHRLGDSTDLLGAACLPPAASVEHGSLFEQAGKRVAQASMALDTMNPGTYVARAILASDGKPIGRVTRPLTIVRAAATEASMPAAVVAAAAPAAAVSEPPAPVTPIAFDSSIETFDRRAVLTRPVLGFFIDRMTVVGLPPVPESPARDRAQ